MKPTIDFGNERVSTLFKKLFYPTLAGMLSMSAVTAIDGIFVGHGVGSDGIAAVNICIPLYMVLTGVGLMAGVGSSVVASVFVARGKAAQARAAVTQALLFVTLLALAVVSPVLAWPEAAGRLFGSSDNLLPQVVDYLLWFSPALVFQLWISVGLFALRLDGAPRLGMWCSVVSAVINVVLDWLFIFPLGWGVMGAAFATSLSIVAGALIVIVYLLFFARRLRLHRLRLDRRGLRFFARGIATQCKIGSAALLGEAAMAVLMLTGNLVFMYYLGDDGVGAFGVSCYYLPFVFMVGNAIAQSAQPIISYNHGMGSRERVRGALRVAVVAAIVCGLVTTAAYVFMPDLLVGLFLPLGTPAADIAVAGLPYCGTGFVCFILNLTLIGYCQSVERIRRATAFALLRSVVFLVPAFVVLPRLLSTAGIWLALPASEALTTLAIVLTVVAARRRAAASR